MRNFSLTVEGELSQDDTERLIDFGKYINSKDFEIIDARSKKYLRFSDDNKPIIANAGIVTLKDEDDELYIMEIENNKSAEYQQIVFWKVDDE